MRFRKVIKKDKKWIKEWWDWEEKNNNKGNRKNGYKKEYDKKDKDINVRNK